MQDILQKKGKKVNLIVLDCEFRNNSDEKSILENLTEFSHSNLTRCGTIIFKTFWNRMLIPSGPLNTLGPLFQTVEAVFPEYTGTNSSELFLRLTHKKNTTDFQMIPDSDSLWKILSEVKAFKSPEEELVRATKLNIVRIISVVMATPNCLACFQCCGSASL